MSLSSLWENEASESASESESDLSSEARAKASEKFAANQRRTSKARIQSLVNRAKRKAGLAIGIDVGTDIASAPEPSSACFINELQEKYFTPRFLHAGFERSSPFQKPDSRGLGRDRSRGLMSYLIQLVRLLERLLTPSTEDPAKSSAYQVLDCVVMDDSSTRIRGQADNMPTLHSVMNAIQTVHIDYNGVCESFQVPTPFICLPSQKTADVHAGYKSWLLVSGFGVGPGLRALEEKATSHDRLQSLIDGAAWKIQVFMGDALPTNSATFRLERERLKQLLQRGVTRHPALKLKCLLHQTCLIGRPAVLSIAGFWPALVRMGHLFEQQSWKRQLGLALFQNLRSPGRFVRSLIE